jgi:hypothetical protein
MRARQAVEIAARELGALIGGGLANRRYRRLSANPV